MRILHVAKKYAAMLGGDAVYVDALVRASRGRGHRAFVTAPNASELVRDAHVKSFGPWIATETLDRLGVHRLRILKHLRTALPDLLAWSSPDVIHAHSADLGYTISRVRELRAPVVLTCHSLSFPTLPRWSAKSFLERWCLRNGRYRAVTVLYPGAIDLLRNIGVAATAWIPGGVDTDVFAPAPKPESDGVRLLYVGRLEPEKGPDILLDALPRIRSRVQLAFVGDGGLRASLEARARSLGGDGRVRFEGAVTNRDTLAARYREADIFVLPSRLEGGIPLSLLEAWACGLPAIATGVTPVADLGASEAAIVVPPGNADALARAIDTLASDATLRWTMGAQGRSLVLERFSWGAVADRFLALYASFG